MIPEESALEERHIEEAFLVGWRPKQKNRGVFGKDVVSRDNCQCSRGQMEPPLLRDGTEQNDTTCAAGGKIGRCLKEFQDYGK